MNLLLLVFKFFHQPRKTVDFLALIWNNQYFENSMAPQNLRSQKHPPLLTNSNDQYSQIILHKKTMVFPQHKIEAKWWISTSSGFPESKLPEKQKVSLGQFPTQSRNEMEVKMLPRRAWKTFIPFPSKDPHQSLVMSGQGKVRRGDKSKLLPTLLIHKVSSPNSSSLSPSHPQRSPGSSRQRLVNRSDLEPNTTGMSSASGISRMALSTSESQARTQGTY